MKTFFLTLTLGVLIFPKSLLLAQVLPIQSGVDEVRKLIEDISILYSVSRNYYILEKPNGDISICVYAGRNILFPQSKEVPLLIKKDEFGKFNKYEVFYKIFQNIKGRTPISENQNQGLYAFEGLSVMFLNEKGETESYFTDFEKAATEVFSADHSNLNMNECDISLNGLILLSKMDSYGGKISIKDLVRWQMDSDVCGFVGAWLDKPPEEVSPWDIKSLIEDFEVLK